MQQQLAPARQVERLIVELDRQEVGRFRRTVRERHYVYIPGYFRREAVGAVWKALSPAETLIIDGDQDVLPPIAVDRVRRTHVDGYPVLRLVSRRGRLAAVADA